MKPAREPVPRPPKPCASLKKSHESCPCAARCGPRRKKKDRGQTSAFPSETCWFAPLILAHRGSVLPWLVDDRAALRLRRIWCVPNRQSATRLSATVLPASRVSPHLPEGYKLELGRGAHLGALSLANHTTAASQPTSWIAKANGWLHLSRVSLPLHPPERPPHTHTPKPGLGGRGARVFFYSPMVWSITRKE